MNTYDTSLAFQSNPIQWMAGSWLVGCGVPGLSFFFSRKKKSVNGEKERHRGEDGRAQKFAWPLVGRERGR